MFTVTICADFNVNADDADDGDMQRLSQLARHRVNERISSLDVQRPPSSLDFSSSEVIWTDWRIWVACVMPLIEIRYDTIGEFNVDWKAEYSALSSTRSQKKELKQTTPVPL